MHSVQDSLRPISVSSSPSSRRSPRPGPEITIRQGLPASLGRSEWTATVVRRPGKSESIESSDRSQGARGVNGGAWLASGPGKFHTCAAMPELVVSGAYTALVTPFTADGSAVDWAAYDKLLEHQLDGRISGLV